MFNHFRTYYPQGNLISELVRIDRGQYIVRAIATADNITLATSLAAAATVEQAEDLARKRLLTFMDIPPADGTSMAKKATPHYHVTPASPPPTQPEPVMSPTPTPTPTQPEPVMSPTPTPTPTQPEPVLNPDPDVEVTEDFDVDEAIAQTDIELERLGWSNKQGRDYLQKTYGPDKVSRKYLSNEELKSFLAYLREQPTPQETVIPDTPSPSPTSEAPDIPSPSPTSEVPAIPSPSPTSEVSVDPNFDFPEAMTQINLEKKRLGWTKGQEQDYLLQTYGRRSRQYLTDQQLAEYLDHLRSL